VDLSPAPLFFFFFNDSATTEIYTLSLHDALPILGGVAGHPQMFGSRIVGQHDKISIPACCSGNFPGPIEFAECDWLADVINMTRSEEHTSELQSLTNLVCRLLLETKKKTNRPNSH